MGAFEADNTSFVMATATGVYGGSTTFSATLAVDGVAIAGQTITFSVDGLPVGTAATNSQGVATLNAASLAGLNVGSYTTRAAIGPCPIAATSTLHVTPANLTITAVANSKTYDGTTSAAAVPTVSGLQGSDSVTGLTEAYADANAGTGKTLCVVAYTVHDGNGGNNYTVSTVNNYSGAITKAPMNLGITSSASPSGLGQSVTFTATLCAAAPGACMPPAGSTVTFMDGNVLIGTATLNGGQAAVSTSAREAGQPHHNGPVQRMPGISARRPGP